VLDAFSLYTVSKSSILAVTAMLMFLWLATLSGDNLVTDVGEYFVLI